MYKSLMELLQKLPKDTQDRIVELAKESRDAYCERYKLTGDDDRETVYRYYLSQRMYFAWFNHVNFDKADPLDLVDLGQVQEYYVQRMNTLTDDKIRKSSKRLTR